MALLCIRISHTLFVNVQRGGLVYMQQITHAVILSSTVPPPLFHGRAQIDNYVFVFYI